MRRMPARTITTMNAGILRSRRRASRDRLESASATSMSSDPTEITGLLQAWRGGDPHALDRLTPLVYDHLRRMAGHYVERERVDRQLNATALVHEAYLKLVDAHRVNWQ